VKDARGDQLCGLPASEVTEADTVAIGEHVIAAARTVCPVCEKWWLDTRFDVAGWTAWRATCPLDHEWLIAR
jgi:hypothetical protein